MFFLDCRASAYTATHIHLVFSERDIDRKYSIRNRVATRQSVVHSSLFMYLCRRYVFCHNFILSTLTEYSVLCSNPNRFALAQCAHTQHTLLQNELCEKHCMMYGLLTQFSKSINILLNYDCYAIDV